jgi:hypothetical protein
MTSPRKNSLSTALLLTAFALLQSSVVLADNKHPPKPGLLLGSHPSKQAQAARLALLKQRTSAVPFKPLHPSKIANSLNHIPGKTITVSRKSPK